MSAPAIVVNDLRKVYGTVVALDQPPFTPRFGGNSRAEPFIGVSLPSPGMVDPGTLNRAIDDGFAVGCLHSIPEAPP